MKNAIKLLAFLFVLAVAAPVKANDEKKGSIGDLRVIGNNNNQPVFQLTLNNTVEDEYTIIIRDSYDNLLYSDRVKGTNITKKFQLAEDVNGESLRVEVRSKKSNLTEVFKIENESKLIHETVVNKVK